MLCFFTCSSGTPSLRIRNRPSWISWQTYVRSNIPMSCTFLRSLFTWRKPAEVPFYYTPLRSILLLFSFRCIRTSYCRSELYWSNPFTVHKHKLLRKYLRMWFTANNHFITLLCVKKRMLNLLSSPLQRLSSRESSHFCSLGLLKSLMVISHNHRFVNK